MSALLLLLSQALAAPAFPLEANVSWHRGVVNVWIVAPPGEHVAPLAPVSGWIRVDSDAPSAINTEGASLAKAGVSTASPGEGDHALSFQLRLSLCQDAGTSCRVVDLAADTRFSGRKGREFVKTGPPRPPEVAPEAPLPSVDEALVSAKASGKAVLMDFATAWCPPCNLLSAQVLHNPADAGALSGYVLTRVDADAVESWGIKSQYHVGGYPTLIAVRPDGVELDRLVGFPGEAATLAWLASIPGQPPLASLPAPEAAAPRDALSAALRLARAYKTDAAAPYLARLTPALAPDLQAAPDLHLARFLASPTADEARWLIAAGVAPDEWLSAAVGLAETDPTLRAPLRAVIGAALAKASPADASDLLYAAGTLATDDKSADAPVLFAAGASALRSALTGDAVADRGYWTLLADLYASAGDLRDAQQVLQDAITAWPHEFTYLNAMAGLLEDQSRPADALPYALGALATSYGDNRLRAVARCARLLGALNKPADALQLLDDTLATAPRPGPNDDVRTTRYIKTLEDLRAQIGAPASKKP